MTNLGWGRVRVRRARVGRSFGCAAVEPPQQGITLALRQRCRARRWHERRTAADLGEDIDREHHHLVVCARRRVARRRCADRRDVGIARLGPQGLMVSHGSKVARLAALAANAVRACDLTRALTALDEIQLACSEAKFDPLCEGREPRSSRYVLGARQPLASGLPRVCRCGSHEVGAHAVRRLARNASSDPPSWGMNAAANGTPWQDRPARRSLVWRCLLALSLTSAGCSFLFVDRAPPAETWPNEHVSVKAELAPCTSWPVAPIIDGVYGLTFASLSAYSATHLDADNATPFWALVGALVAIPYLVSTIYGFETTASCRTYLAGPPYP
jgi:hypothetical protein